MPSWLAFLLLWAAWALMVVSVKEMVRDFREDVRWYRSQPRCRFCHARLDPEWARRELEMIVQRYDGRDDA